MAVWGVLLRFPSGQITVTIGAVRVEVLFSEPRSQFPGVWQIKVRGPEGLSGQMPLFVALANAGGNAVTAYIRCAAFLRLAALPG